MIEIIRRLVRTLVPMSAYRIMAELVNYSVLLKRGETDLLNAYRKPRANSLYKVYVKSVDKDVWVRGDSPDLECLVQNLVREEYGSARQSKAPGFIIDGGGYIGDTALFFQRLFPDVRLVVLEPDPRNFEICKRNLEENEQITILQAGLGAESGYMSTEGAFWSAKTMKVDSPTASAADVVPVTGLDELLEQFDLSPPGILKMDIEGAETEVLNDRGASWPEKMEIILVETHGKESECAVSAFAEHYHFLVRKYRSIHVLSK